MYSNNSYRYLLLVSQRDNRRERAISLARGNCDDPRSRVLKRLRTRPVVPGRVHDGDPLLDGMQGAERILLGNSERQREHVHPVMDGVVDGREHACTVAIPDFSPKGLVHGNAGAGRAATRSARGEPVEAGRLNDRACRGGGRVRAVGGDAPGRQVVSLQYLFGHAGAVEPRADDLAAAVAAVPGLPDLAHAFPS